MDICYRCGKPAVSREHVPPICLFPSKDEIGLNILRKDLITVRSCDEHNSKKSKDDEFLLLTLPGIVTNNIVGYYYTKTKVRRVLNHHGKGLMKGVFKDSKKKKVTINGKEYRILKGKVSVPRLTSCFENIAYGIFFHEYQKVFKGELTIVIDFLAHQDENDRALKAMCESMFQTHLNDSPVKGQNPEIFQYQLIPADNSGLISLKMSFYQGAHVYVVFKEESIQLPFSLASELIKAKKPVTFLFEGHGKAEFNKD